LASVDGGGGHGARDEMAAVDHGDDPQNLASSESPT
jgi:hypothetical protein